MIDEKVKRGFHIDSEKREKILKEIEEILFTKGFNWNKSELARKHNTTHETITNMIKEICDKTRNSDYESMQIMRLEKNRELLLEELDGLKSKNKPRSHILRELRDTEKEIREMRIKYGFTENKEVVNINEINPIKINVNIPAEVKELLEARKNGTN